MIIWLSRISGSGKKINSIEIHNVSDLRSYFYGDRDKF
tara:strand:+ start:33 stop:146 length:114 start_codon:yes stop_codon:yes gene_type:complete